jgi:hypothetical protein
VKYTVCFLPFIHASTTFFLTLLLPHSSRHSINRMYCTIINRSGSKLISLRITLNSPKYGLVRKQM